MSSTHFIVFTFTLVCLVNYAKMTIEFIVKKNCYLKFIYNVKVKQNVKQLKKFK